MGLADIGEISLLLLENDRTWKRIGEWSYQNGLQMFDNSRNILQPNSGQISVESTIVRIVTLEEPPVRIDPYFLSKNKLLFLIFVPVCSL